MSKASQPRIALVHHWVVTMRGGERVLEAMLELFPHADLFTLVCDRSRIPSAFRQVRIRTSYLQHLPRSTRWYPYYLPLFPWATERLDLSGYDLVISSDAATMKGVRVAPGIPHICYCHTPMRYVWNGNGYEAYYRAAGPLARLVWPWVRSRLRRWDHQAAQCVTHFVANSQNVAARIRSCYSRESEVIYPPVDTDAFCPSPSARHPEDFFLVVSQLSSYKRVDLAVEAFNRCNRRLVVIGEGPECRKLESRAHSNIRFLGFQPDAVVRKAMQRCRALVFPGEEDFGIVMVEAQACGKPVVAYRCGGAREIIADEITGILFEEQSPEGVLSGLDRFEHSPFDAEVIRASALRFSRPRFLREFSGFVERVVGSKPSSDTLEQAFSLVSEASTA